MLKREQDATEIASIVLVQIEEIRKSILARAFRGELGTNNLLDEKASVLLGKVL